MEFAASIGIIKSEFDEMTPYELYIMAKGYLKRKQSDNDEYLAKYRLLQKDLTYTAFLVSRWVWQKKIDINRILKAEPNKKIMTPDEMLNKVKMINAMFGGDVIDG